MPAHHDVRAADVNEKRLGAVLALAHERDLPDLASFLQLEQLGPRTLQSLALVGEVVHGTRTRFEDPARDLRSPTAGRTVILFLDEGLRQPRGSLNPSRTIRASSPR
jgi:hypothetical protein